MKLTKSKFEEVIMEEIEEALAEIKLLPSWQQVKDFGSAVRDVPNFGSAWKDELLLQTGLIDDEEATRRSDARHAARNPQKIIKRTREKAYIPPRTRRPKPGSAAARLGGQARPASQTGPTRGYKTTGPHHLPPTALTSTGMVVPPGSPGFAPPAGWTGPTTSFSRHGTPSHRNPDWEVGDDWIRPKIQDIDREVPLPGMESTYKARKERNLPVDDIIDLWLSSPGAQSLEYYDADELEAWLDKYGLEEGVLYEHVELNRWSKIAGILKD